MPEGMDQAIWTMALCNAGFGNATPMKPRTRIAGRAGLVRGFAPGFDGLQRDHLKYWAPLLCDLTRGLLDMPPQRLADLLALISTRANLILNFSSSPYLRSFTLSPRPPSPSLSPQASSSHSPLLQSTSQTRYPASPAHLSARQYSSPRPPLS